MVSIATLWLKPRTSSGFIANTLSRLWRTHYNYLEHVNKAEISQGEWRAGKQRKNKPEARCFPHPLTHHPTTHSRPLAPPCTTLQSINIIVMVMRDVCIMAAWEKFKQGGRDRERDRYRGKERDRDTNSDSDTRINYVKCADIVIYSGFCHS